MRKIEIPMSFPSSGAKPSQFAGSQQDEVPGVQYHGIDDDGVDEHGYQGHVPEGLDRNDADGDGGGLNIDIAVNQQDRAQGEDVDRGVADTAVEHQPVVRGKRNRKPNSKYDPAVYDLDSVDIRGIPLSGKKNGYRGIYWLQ